MTGRRTTGGGSGRGTRRRYLEAVSALCSMALAGCTDALPGGLGDDGSSSGGETGSETGSESAGKEATTALEAGRFVTLDMAAGRFEDAYERFGSAYRNRVSAGALENIWLGYTAVGGSFDSIEGTETSVKSGFDAVELTLSFERGDHQLQVLADGDADVTGIVVADEYSSPEYVDPDAFETQGTTLETGDCQLDAAVTVPDEDGDVPATVLVHGSDPLGVADKDLTASGTKMFKDLAEGLATRGVAVLRYDRRTYACGDSLEPAEYTLDRVSVDDALVAIEELRGIDGVDADRISVAGHSLGALAAPRIAERDGGLAGAVAMAAPARSFYELTVDQLDHRVNVGEYEHDRVAQQYESWQERVDRIRNGEYNPGDRILNYPGAFWDSLAEYDGFGTANGIDTPLFFLQGTRDFQVTAEDDFQLWQSELSGRSGTRFDRYDGLNHLFMPGEGPSVPTEYSVQNNVAETLLKDVATWLREEASS